MPRLGIGFSILGRLEHSAKNGDQGFFHPAVQILERLEFLLGRSLGFSDASKEHFNQLVAAVRTGLLKQAEKQGVPLTRPAHAQQIAHFHRSGFSGELSEFGVGDAFQHRVRIDNAGQPAEPVRPQPDRLWACGSRDLLEAIESCGHSARLDDQQSIQRRRVGGLQSGHDLIVHPCMDLGTQMVCQPLERAEGWQVSGRRRLGTGPGPPFTYGFRPQSRSLTCSMTGFAPTRRLPASMLSGITAMSACQAGGRAALSSMH
jgi:hypothetical protein